MLRMAVWGRGTGASFSVVVMDYRGRVPGPAQLTDASAMRASRACTTTSAVVYGNTSSLYGLNRNRCTKTTSAVSPAGRGRAAVALGHGTGGSRAAPGGRAPKAWPKRTGAARGAAPGLVPTLRLPRRSPASASSGLAHVPSGCRGAPGRQRPLGQVGRPNRGNAATAFTPGELRPIEFLAA